MGVVNNNMSSNGGMHSSVVVPAPSSAAAAAAAPTASQLEGGVKPPPLQNSAGLSSGLMAMDFTERNRPGPVFGISHHKFTDAVSYGFIYSMILHDCTRV